MSWSDRAGAVFAVAGLLGLSGCFTPLYSESSHPGLAETMREVSITPVNGRLGYYLVDDLTTDMNGTGQTPAPKYKLKVVVAQGVNSPTVESQLALATSATVFASVSFVLSKLEDEKVVYSGVANAMAPYDRSFDNYANLRASRDAELRLARALAQEIELRVAGALAAKG